MEYTDPLVVKEYKLDLEQSGYCTCTDFILRKSQDSLPNKSQAEQGSPLTKGLWYFFITLRHLLQILNLHDIALVTL